MGDLISGAPQQKHRGILTTEMFFQPLQRNFYEIESLLTSGPRRHSMA